MDEGNILFQASLPIYIGIQYYWICGINWLLNVLSSGSRSLLFQGKASTNKWTLGTFWPGGVNDCEFDQDPLAIKSIFNYWYKNSPVVRYSTICIVRCCTVQKYSKLSSRETLLFKRIQRHKLTHSMAINRRKCWCINTNSKNTKYKIESS